MFSQPLDLGSSPKLPVGTKPLPPSLQAQLLETVEDQDLTRCKYGTETEVLYALPSGLNVANSAVQLRRRQRRSISPTKSLSSSTASIWLLDSKQTETERRQSGRILTTMRTTGHPRPLSGMMGPKSLLRIATLPRPLPKNKPLRKPSRRSKRRRPRPRLPKQSPPLVSDPMRLS